MPENKIIQLVVGPIQTNCWIYPFRESDAAHKNQPAKCAVIDPGDNADLIISTLKNNSLTPEYILLTHGHFDHILAIPNFIAAFNPAPQIVIHHLDSQFLGPDSYQNHCRSIRIAMGCGGISDAIINSLPQSMPSADIFVDEGSETGPFTVLHTPGHTPGSVSYWEKEAGVIFTGDTLFKDGFGRTDIPGGDPKQIYYSVGRLLKLDKNIIVYPGHGETTTIAREAK